MAMKRKAEFEESAETEQRFKQLKLVPFPLDTSMDVDMDVDMDTASLAPFTQHHARLPSNASSSSSNSSGGISPTYPAFNLYPNGTPIHTSSGSHSPRNFPYYGTEGASTSYFPSSHRGSSPNMQPDSMDFVTTAAAVGLLQPSSDFKHNGNTCTQIPKLRIACADATNGRRTMWSHCEECGAISMVDTD